MAFFASQLLVSNAAQIELCSWPSNGGSIKTILNRCFKVFCCKNLLASTSFTLSCLASSMFLLSLSWVAAALFISSAVQLSAPRDRASKLRAPDPANTSRQWAPGIWGASQLKTVSRMRLLVGRRPGAETNPSCLLRHCPPIILSLFELVALVFLVDKETLPHCDFYVLCLG